MFHSGMFSDSYTYVRRWCNRGQASGGRMRHVLKSYFDTIVKLRVLSCAISYIAKRLLRKNNIGEQ